MTYLNLKVVILFPVYLYRNKSYVALSSTTVSALVLEALLQALLYNGSP